MNKKLRVGVIGLGIGRLHIKGFQSHPDSEVTAVSDLDEERLARTCDEFHIEKRYSNYQEMLDKENLDIVSIATPNILHKPMTLAAFKSGCHVFCEKPMAMNAAEGREMLKAADEACKRLLINFSFRFMEQSVVMKEQIDSGVLGHIYFGRTVWHRRMGMPIFGGWFGQKKMSGGGPLIDIGVHRLDLALWLMGYPKPVYVAGSTYNYIASEKAKNEGKVFEVEDLAAGFIKFDNGATLILEASWAANIGERELMETRLLGTKGGLLQRNIDGGYSFKTELFLEQNGHQIDMKLRPKPVQDKDSSMYHFIDSIVNNKPHIATGEEGLIVMEILDAMYESSKQGKPVCIDTMKDV